MDYKYIEQLLERYWNCETNVEEEEILRIFFRQKNLPEHLLRYKPLFAYNDKQRGLKLGRDFEESLLSSIPAETLQDGKPKVKAIRLAPRSRFAPFMKAAAMIALVFVVGGIVDQSMQTGKSPIVYVYDQFDNQSSDPQVAEADTAKASLTSSAACGTSCGAASCTIQPELLE